MESIFLKLLNMSIAASYLVIAVVLLRLILKRAPKFISLILWAMVGVRLILPISLESSFSLVPSTQVLSSGITTSQSQPIGDNLSGENNPITDNSIVDNPSVNNSIIDSPSVDKAIVDNWGVGNLLAGIPSVDIPATQSPAVDSASPATPQQAVPDVNNQSASQSDVTDETTSKSLYEIFTTVASFVWLGGFAAILTYAVISYIRVRLKVREAVNLEGNIMVCDRVASPFILGIIRPKIYMPSTLYSGDIRYVLAHENAHLKRRDHFWKPFGFLLLSVYWFNPVLWVAYILLCRDIELACDEKVIKELGAEAKKPYSTALVNCSVSRKVITVCPLAFGEVGVKRRVKTVLNYKKPAFWIVIVAVILCIAVAACFLTIRPSEDADTTTAINSTTTTTNSSTTTTTESNTTTSTNPNTTTTTDSNTTTSTNPNTTTTTDSSTTTTKNPEPVTDPDMRTDGVINKKVTKTIYSYDVNEYDYTVGRKQSREITYKGTIKIGNTAASTGAFAQVGEPFNEGLLAYINYVNYNGGLGGSYATGKQGYYVEFIHYDDSFQSDTGCAYTKKLVEEDKVFAIVGHFGTPTVDSTIDYIKEQGVIACYFASGSDSVWNVNADSVEEGSTLFPVQPVYTTEGRITVARIVEQYPEAKKIGIIYTNDEIGKGIRNGAQAQLDSLDAPYSYVLSEVSTNSNDYTSAVAKVADCDVVIIAATQNRTASIIKAMISNGIYKPCFTSYSVASATLLVDINAYYSTLSSADKFPIYSNTWISSTDIEAYMEFAWYILAYTGSNESILNSSTMAGWMAATVFCEGVERVLESGKELNNLTYVEAMESAPIELKIGSYATSAGELVATLDYSDGIRIGTTTMGLLKNNSEYPSFEEAGEAKNFLRFLQTGDIEDIK